MKKFLFVIPQSPSASVSSFRRELIMISRLSLEGQKSKDWEAVFLGEESGSQGNFHFLNLGGVSKEQKLHHFVDWMEKQENRPEYLIRFDDDDLISPSVLEEVISLDFDCYSDRWHQFYDTSSGKCSRQKREWLPNTVIHKTAHALVRYGEYHKDVFSKDRKPSLFQNDHSSTWHMYYKEKSIVYSPKRSPIYLRVLSPSSITGNRSAVFDQNDYTSYRLGFGIWDSPIPIGFETYILELKRVWEKEFGSLKKYDISLLTRMNYKLRELLS